MWKETNQSVEQYSSSMIDLVFRIQCPRLPVDHAMALAGAVYGLAPEIKKQAGAGVHAIHVAGSQNGWARPESADEHLLLSKRTRLQIRVGIENAAQVISTLSGATLDVSGLSLHIISGKQKPFTPSSTLFCRHTYFEGSHDDKDESEFEQRIVACCEKLSFSPTKILCGREHTLNTNTGLRLTRSVLLADIGAAESILLQEHGLGDGRPYGCGLLIPHKDTGAVNEAADASLH